MKPYSEDLRISIVNALRGGMSKSPRRREALIEAMGRALDSVTTRDTRGFFEHRGYRSLLGQPL
jgi:hypothetical protein